MFRPSVAAVDRFAGVLTGHSPLSRSATSSSPRDSRRSASRPSSELRVFGVGLQSARLHSLSSSRGSLRCCSAASSRDPAQSEHPGAALPWLASDSKRRTSVIASFLPSLAGLLGCIVPSSEQMEGVFSGTTVSELEIWLQQNGVDTVAYGSPPAKSIAELLEEVRSGACVSAFPGSPLAMNCPKMLCQLCYRASTRAPICGFETQCPLVSAPCQVELGESLLQVVEGKLVRVVSVLNVFIENTNGEVHPAATRLHSLLLLRIQPGTPT